MKIERRDSTEKSEIEARALGMLFDLLQKDGKSAVFVRWGNDKTEPDAYITLDGKKIGVEITQIWGESPTASAKAEALEKQLIEGMKQTILKCDWRGCISIHLSRHLKNNNDITMILKELEKAIGGIKKEQEVTIRLHQIGSLTMYPWKDQEEKKRIIVMTTMSLCSDEDNVPFIMGIDQAVNKKRHHRYGEHENWLLCIDRSTVGLLVEDEEMKAVEGRIEELRPQNFQKIIIVQSTTDGTRGMYSSHKQKEA